MKFVLIHGSFSTPNDAWFPWLGSELKKLGHETVAPQFPVDLWSKVGELEAKDYKPSQNIDGWFEKFDEIKDNLVNGQKSCFIGHSIGPLFILHLVSKYNFIVENAFFVAPFFEIHGKSEIVEKANKSFYKRDFNFGKLRSLIPKSTVFYGSDDPYVDHDKSIEFATEMNSKIVKMNNVGHMGIESGMKEFPELLNVIKKEMT